MADRTIPELEAVHIYDLPSMADLYDDDLLAVSQQGIAKKMTGAQWKQYAKDSVQAQVDEVHSRIADAQQLKEDAAQSAQNAADSAKEAEQQADRATEQADKAEEYSGNPAIIQGDNETWWIWDADQQTYVDTHKPSKGNLLYASFWVDPTDGMLYMITDNEYDGPKFQLNKNILEVVING